MDRLDAFVENILNEDKKTKHPTAKDWSDYLTS